MQQPSPHFVASSPFKKIFVPWRLLAGLGLIVAGVLVLGAIWFFSHRISLKELLFGPLLSLIGIGLAASSRAQGCSTCKATLDDTSTTFPLELTPHVQQAVGWAGQGNVEGLLQLQQAPLANTERMSTVMIEYCPSCRGVAEVCTATNVRLGDGTSTQEGITPKVVVLGPGVARMLEMVGHRNTALTHAMYGGPAPQ